MPGCLPRPTEHDSEHFWAMNVTNIEITKSPISASRTCVRADVICDDKTVPAEVYWIDVPQAYASHLNGSGNPWLALLLPLAVTLGEPLIISKPVDRGLFSNVHELMHIWNCWYHLKPVAIEADIQEHQVQPSGRATAALFSGGVDAWFTLLTHGRDSNRPDRVRIDDLLCVWGLDIKLDKTDEFRALRDALVRATDGLGMDFVEVATNVLQTSWQRRVNCWHRFHNCALASIAHALSGRYARLLVPSSHRYDYTMPWGSHPLTDPLLSSSRTKIIHDGAGFSRVEKTETLIESEAALNSLQVCWATGCYRNCEACSKCYRTMTTLFLLGALDRCPRFRSSNIDKRKVAKIFTREENDRAFLREVRALAVRTGHPDIARAIDRGFRRSRRLELCLGLANRLVRLTSPKWQRRLDWRIERLLLRNSIR